MSAASNVWAVARKEWRHYFGSPIAYVALAVWALLYGIFFHYSFAYFLMQSMRSAGSMELGAKLSLNEWVIRPVFQNMAVVALFLTPMLTMRLFAEEKRQGTIELLATSPITSLQIIVGKFTAAVGLYALMVMSGLLDLVLVWYRPTVAPEWKPVLTGVLGHVLLGAAFIALGLFVSSLTRNQIVAGAVTFCLFLGIWTLGWADDPMADTFTRILAYLGVTVHMDDLFKGVLSLKDVVYYLSVIAFGLFLTQQSVKSERWRA